MRDNNEAKRENDEKSFDKNREQSVKLEEMRKKEEAQRIEKIKAETKNMLQIEKQKEELAKQKSVLEMKTMQIQAERDREKEMRNILKR